MNSFWITTCFYKVSLFVLIFLLIVVIAMSATDIIVQALSTAATASGTFKYSNLVVVGVSYALLVRMITRTSVWCNVDLYVLISARLLILCRLLPPSLSLAVDSSRYAECYVTLPKVIFQQMTYPR